MRWRICTRKRKKLGKIKCKRTGGRQKQWWRLGASDCRSERQTSCPKAGASQGRGGRLGKFWALESLESSSLPGGSRAWPLISGERGISADSEDVCQAEVETPRAGNSPRGSRGHSPGKKTTLSQLAIEVAQLARFSRTAAEETQLPLSYPVMWFPNFLNKKV